MKLAELNWTVNKLNLKKKICFFSKSEKLTCVVSLSRCVRVWLHSFQQQVSKLFNLNVDLFYLLQTSKEKVSPDYNSVDNFSSLCYNRSQSGWNCCIRLWLHSTQHFSDKSRSDYNSADYCSPVHCKRNRSCWCNCLRPPQQPIHWRLNLSWLFYFTENQFENG